MIVWGGFGNGDALSTGGRYNPSTDSWIPIGQNAPEGRVYHSAIWTGFEMIVWGGLNGVTNLDLASGGRYDPSIDNWVATNLLNAPEARALHAAVWTGMEMIIWGGSTPNIDLSTGGRYIPVSDSWIAMNNTNAPVARSLPTGVWTGEEMIVWGGCDYSFICYSTGGRYNPGIDTWVATSNTNAPSGRNLHTAVWTSSQMIIWGGHDQNGMFASGGIYDPASDTWSPTSTVNAPSAREDHAAVWGGNKMIIWGGVDGNYASTGGLYDPSTDSWTQTSLNGAPEARQLPTAVWIGDEMIVWGGIGQGGYLNTGGRYNRSLNTWSPLTTLNAPTPRVLHTALWTGTEVIVWGGRNDTPNFFNTGGRYCAAFRPSVYVDDSSVIEGNSGTVDLNFNVNLFVSSTQDVTINYETADDTAKTSDGDYQSANSSITIPAGQTQGTITIHVNGDTKYETDETFFVNVTNATNAYIGDGQARGTITNDDAVPSLSISDATMPEGNGGQTPMTFQVILSAANSLDTTVQYATADSTATAASGDYASASGMLTIPAGSTSTTVTVLVNGDTVFEPNETFFVNLSNPTNATISDGQGMGEIVNDEPNGPLLFISDVSKKEGKNGTVAFSFTVTLSAMVASPVTVQYATADGTATVSGNDYVAASGFLTIPGGMKKGTITVQVRADKILEPNETFFVNRVIL
jgi:N-acetylneuraminic acid mutarotase